MEQTKQLLTSKQLEQALQVAPSTLWRWRKQGMPFINIGGNTIRYDLDDVLHWTGEKVHGNTKRN